MEKPKKRYTLSVCYKTRVEAESDDAAIREATYPVPTEGTSHLAIAVVHCAIIQPPATVPEEAQPNAS